jgi:LysM repeat protein
MNEKQKEELLAEAFAACLDDMEGKGASLADCLARYPELRDDLEPALLTIGQINVLPQWQVSPEFKATAAQRIVRKIRQRQSQPSLRTRLSGFNPTNWISNLGFAPLAVRVAVVVLAGLLVVTGGTAIAATDTQPDSPLHQVKLATENIELLLRPAGEARTTLLIEILDRRASELLTMSWQDKTDPAQRALVNYQAALQVGHKMLAGYDPANSNDAVSAVQWQEALARNLAVMQGLVDAMKPSVQPVLRTAISNSQQEQTWVNSLLVKTPQPADIATPAPGAGTQGTPTPGRCVYTVKNGDTLSNIAQRHNTTWQRLAALNSVQSPDSIYAGQQIVVPCTTAPGDGQLTPPAEFKLCQYTVKSGDTLSSIAQVYNTTTRLLIAANNIPTADRILAGQRLSVPCYVK